LNWIIYLAAAFFAGADFFDGDFGLDAFLVAAFFVPVDLEFFGVGACLAFGLAAFFVVVDFLTPAGFAVCALACVGFFVFEALADLDVALDRGLAALAILTFFGLAAVVVALLFALDVPDAAVVVAELFVLAAVATFLADLVPADFERARFFVPDALLDDEADFFGLVDFLLATFFSFSSCC